MEALAFWVPVEAAVGLHGDVVEEAGGAGAVADFHGCGGLFARADALDPVEVLLGAGVEVDLVGADDGVEDFGVAGDEGLDREFVCGGGGGRGLLVTGDKEVSFGAVPLDAVGEVARDVHGDAVGVDGVGEELSVNIPEAVGGEFRSAPDLDGAGVLGVHTPVGGVDVVCSPAGDHAGAELLHAEPAGTVEAVEGHDAVEGVGDFGGRAEPCVVVEVGGDGHGGGVAACGVSGEADLDMFDLADAAVADEFAGAVELLPGALLAADLEDAS